MLLLRCCLSCFLGDGATTLVWMTVFTTLSWVSSTLFESFEGMSIERRDSGDICFWKTLYGHLVPSELRSPSCAPDVLCMLNWDLGFGTRLVRSALLHCDSRLLSPNLPPYSLTSICSAAGRLFISTLMLVSCEILTESELALFLWFAALVAEDSADMGCAPWCRLDCAWTCYCSSTFMPAASRRK